MMRRSCVGLLLLVFAWSCGPYKELKPKPEVAATEAASLPLGDGDKSFEIKKEKSYHVKFPAIAADDYYLVVETPADETIDFYLTRQLDKKKTMVRMPDQTPENDGVGVYRLDQTVPLFYWVIDNVRTDVKLNSSYRYLPAWRYKSETLQKELGGILEQNRVDRQVFESLGTAISSSELDTDGELRQLKRKTDDLQAAQGSLPEIDNLIPATGKTGGDPAYGDYLRLKRDLEEELAFQAQYRNVLRLFQQTAAASSDVDGFVEAIPSLKQFFDNASQYPANVVAEAQKAVSTQLATLAGDYDSRLRDKRDVTAIAFPVEDARALYRATGRQPDSRFRDMVSFVDAFNGNAEAITAARSEIDAIQGELRKEQQWPDNAFYPNLQRRLERLQSPRSGSYGAYSSYTAARAMDREATLVADRVSRLRGDMQRAGQVVASINQARGDNDFQSIIQLLKNNRDLSFLTNQYPDLDRLSLQRQEAVIQERLAAGNWSGAEEALRNLYNDNDFINYEKAQPEKIRLVKQYEENLAAAIVNTSRERARAFIDANTGTYANVPALYEDEAFRPVHTLGFSGGGQALLERKNAELVQELETYRNTRFPQLAISKLYADFSNDIRNDGILKARAVVEHGRRYTGKERQILNLIAECDPYSPKYLTKATSYRKIYVLPMNDAQGKTNEYMFRLNLQIPSDAKFPVFDVNIKLPRELARSSETEQWYKEMKLNKKILKNEGRFTITAPTKGNNYECQITPLQVDKEGNNILEIRFNHDAFKVLEVSVMAQRSIIRKN